MLTAEIITQNRAVGVLEGKRKSNSSGFYIAVPTQSVQLFYTAF